MNEVIIRPVLPHDASEIADIYNYYIVHTVVTFELSPLSAEEMSTRIKRISIQFPFLVAVQNNAIIGYAYADTWKQRAAYDYSAETSIYLKPGLEGLGIGTALYAQLLDRLKATSIKTAIGGISLPNQTSIALHEKLGFKKIGEFERVGYKLEQWINVGYWQLHF